MSLNQLILIIVIAIIITCSIAFDKLYKQNEAILQTQTCIIKSLNAIIEAQNEPNNN